MLHKPYENNNYNKKKSGHDITQISKLFNKYVKLLKAPQGTVVKACVDVIQEVYGLTVRKDQVVYQVSSKTLTLHLSGPLKSEIMLNKKVILEDIGRRVGAESVPKNIL
jgi:hypothetical protein